MVPVLLGRFSDPRGVAVAFHLNDETESISLVDNQFVDIHDLRLGIRPLRAKDDYIVARLKQL
jgi:hypothetical protein